MVLFPSNNTHTVTFSYSKCNNFEFFSYFFYKLQSANPTVLVFIHTHNLIRSILFKKIITYSLGTPPLKISFMDIKVLPNWKGISVKTIFFCMSEYTYRNRGMHRNSLAGSYILLTEPLMQY